MYTQLTINDLCVSIQVLYTLIVYHTLVQSTVYNKTTLAAVNSMNTRQLVYVYCGEMHVCTYNFEPALVTNECALTGHSLQPASKFPMCIACTV